LYPKTKLSSCISPFIYPYGYRLLSVDHLMICERFVTFYIFVLAQKAMILHLISMYLGEFLQHFLADFYERYMFYHAKRVVM
jgi:hypothetical protein